MNRARRLTTATIVAALSAAAPATAAPVNDSFATPTTISGVSAPAPTSYTTAQATKQVGEPGVAVGARTVWFKWTPNDAGAAFADVCGAASMHYVRVYRVKPGQATALTALESARDVDSAHLVADSACRARWRAAEGVAYYVQVNHTGSAPAHSLVINQDTVAPAAPTISSAWPNTTARSHQAVFSSAGADAYVCALDNDDFKTCQSPHWLAFVPDGTHTFKTRAIDGHGNLSEPATRTWNVDATGPKTTFTSPIGITGVRPTLTWTTDDPGATTYCQVDDWGVGQCTSPWTAPIVSPGEHRLEVFAKDAFGNRGETVTATWIMPQPEVQTPPQEWQNPATREMSESLPCRKVRLFAPEKVTRAAARRGIKIRVTGEIGKCSTIVAVTQGGRTLAKSALLQWRAPGAVEIKLKAKKARRGTLKISASGLQRTVRVR